MADTQRRQRRTILAEREAQIRIVLWFLLHLLVYTTLTLALILLPSLLRLTTEGFSLEEQFAASRDFLFIDTRIVPIMLAMSLLGVVHFLFLTHRMFGPLVRLRGALRRWREQGVLPAPMHVRRHDFHGQLFEEFSHSTTALGEDLSAARELVRLAAGQARLLAPPPGPGEPATGAQAVAEQCRLALERLDRWQQ